MSVRFSTNRRLGTALEDSAEENLGCGVNLATGYTILSSCTLYIIVCTTISKITRTLGPLSDSLSTTSTQNQVST